MSSSRADRKEKPDSFYKVARFFAAQQMTFQSTQINWLVISSSILNRIASILDVDPDSLLKSTGGRRVSNRAQERERDSFAGLVKRAAEKSLVLLSKV
jgi:hypothetical protein